MKTKITFLALLMFTGLFSAHAQGGTWNCGTFIISCADTIVDDCSLNIICSGDVSITNLDTVNSFTCVQTLNSIAGNPSGWTYSLCNPNGCQPIGQYTSSFVVPAGATRGASFHAHINGNYGNPILRVTLKDQNNTANSTTFHIQLGTGVTAIQEQSSSENSLSQNFPNPFSETSVMNYNLPSGKGTLVITDVLGRTVSNTQLTSTSGSVTIGEGLSKGIFFCSLADESGKTIATRKIIVE